MLNGCYKLPTRKTISNSMIPRIYNKTLEHVRDKINKSFAVCLTTDGWTSLKNESFIGVTAHFIGEDNTLQSVCVGINSFDDRHTIENLAIFLKNTVQEWNIENKMVAVVSDNAPNIVGAIRVNNFRHISCFAHNVNLVVQTAIKKIENVHKKIKTIVEHFKRSSHAQARLQAVQKQMGLPQLKLKQDVLTRWNSTYDMFHRILEIKDAVVSTMALLQCDMDQITVAEWDIIKYSTDVLKIFFEVTNEISSDRYVSMSKVLIFIQAMKVSMENYQRNPNLPQEVQNLVIILLEKLNSRFIGYEDNELVTQAALLDPRFKKLSFNGYNPRKLQIALDHLKTKVCQVNLPELENSINFTVTIPSTNTPSSSILWKEFDESYTQNIAQNPMAAGIIELDKYLQQPLINRSEDPLSWWKVHKVLYPRLFIMVKKRLCVPATSVPCERLFSKAGMVITDRRNRMLASKSSQVLFLNQNL